MRVGRSRVRCANRGETLIPERGELQVRRWHDRRRYDGRFLRFVRGYAVVEFVMGWCDVTCWLGEVGESR
jgi:hypothetical protein